MERHVLINSRSVDRYSHIVDRLERAGVDWGEEFIIDHAKNQKEAMHRLEGVAYDAIVSDVELPRDRDSALSVGEHLGLECLKHVRDQHRAIPFVLLDMSRDIKLQRDVNKLSDADYVSLDYPDWDDWIIDSCHKFFSHTGSSQRLTLELDIFLHPLDRCAYHMRVIGAPGLEDQGPLEIKPKTLRKLTRDSQRVSIKDYPAWEEDLRDIGEALGDEIFRGNYDFSTKFHEFRGKVESRRDVNIRFIIGEEVHPVVLEALKEANEHFWMLEGPVYRRVKEHTNRYALFQDEETRSGPLNCLIIDADVGSALVPELGITLDPLDNVKDEVRDLVDILENDEIKKAYQIEDVRVLKFDRTETDAAARVEAVLAEKDWHIVHYAGHSIYDEEDRTGYFFLPGKKVTAVKVSTFASWLNNSNVRFLYLSSCKSSAQNFVFVMANYMVPAIVGFRWDLEDELAARYTQEFYNQLFKNKSLEYAFFETRKLMHGEFPNKPVWASPILVVQAKKE